MRLRHDLAIAILLAGGQLVAGQAAADPSALPPQFAYDYGETETPRSAGVSAMHALGSSLTAMFINPANLGLTRSYHIGAITEFLPEAKKQMYGGAIIDSTRRVSGGVSFVGGIQDPDGVHRSTLDARIALAVAVSKALHLGISGRYLSLDQDGLGPLGWSRASGGLLDPSEQGPAGGPAWAASATPPATAGRQRMLSTVTLDAGATFKPIEQLAIAAFGQNLTYPNNGLLPTLVGGALGFGTGDFSIEADGLADLNSYAKPSPRVMAGGEYLLLNHVPLRLGYRYDMLNGTGLAPSHAISGGLGWVEPRFGVEASVRRTVVGPSATFVFIGATYYLESLRGLLGPS